MDVWNEYVDMVFMMILMWVLSDDDDDDNNVRCDTQFIDAKTISLWNELWKSFNNE